jgi:hypothetical protein
MVELTRVALERVNMDDKTIQRKLNQLRKIANELDDEARKRWPQSGMLFYEGEGHFCLMDGDEDGTPENRQKHIKFEASGVCHMGCGSW